MLRILCILLAAAGPWLGPVRPDAQTAPTGSGHEQILACALQEGHVLGTTPPHDQRPVEGGGCIATGAIADPPVRISAWEHGRAGLPHPTRVFLITVHSSSFL